MNNRSESWHNKGRRIRAGKRWRLGRPNKTRVFYNVTTEKLIISKNIHRWLRNHKKYVYIDIGNF
jgi:hypothetical protein